MAKVPNTGSCKKTKIKKVKSSMTGISVHLRSFIQLVYEMDRWTSGVGADRSLPEPIFVPHLVFIGVIWVG